MAPHMLSTQAYEIILQALKSIPRLSIIPWASTSGDGLSDHSWALKSLPELKLFPGLSNPPRAFKLIMRTMKSRPGL